MTEKELRDKVIETAESWLGAVEGSAKHKEIMDLYNAHKPLARGYAVKYTDAWCATFVSAVAIKCGLTDIIPPECGCEKMIELFKALGRWQEDESVMPETGDIIFYDWGDDGHGDNKGYADHVGIVVSVEGNTITVIEGNVSIGKTDGVGLRIVLHDSRYIRGYGKPDYASKADETETADEKNDPVTGIDVSKWQEEIDWDKVAADGVQFAMIRLGYGSADGEDCHVDSFFEKNVFNAMNSGIDVGCYFYSYATSIEAAKKEAEFVVGVLEKYKGTFTYPIALDVEDKTQSGLGKTVLTDMVIAFGDIIEDAGFYFTVYSSLSWFRNYLDDKRLSRFDHWLAQWAEEPSYSGEFGLWQSSATGKVDGIDGNVDTDIAYKDYPRIIRSKKLNGFTSEMQKPVDIGEVDDYARESCIKAVKNGIFHGDGESYRWQDGITREELCVVLDNLGLLG